VSNTNRSAIGFSSNMSNDHESLGANHDQEPYLNTGFSSARLPYREGVPSEHDVYTRKFFYSMEA